MKSNNKQKAFFNRLELVTANDFVKFLDAKGVTSICPMCGVEGAQIIDETRHVTLEDLTDDQQGRIFVTYFRHTPENPGDSDANYYYKMSCGNCGYITTHNVGPVLRWLDSLQSKSSGDDK
ncbi:hypothetical protein ACP6EW_20770 [Hafnia paralvei]|uniref:hypothetical protein n=1 Tax=Hafnia paralvei TaxID=546367 RepID=UPI003CF14EFE